MAQHAIQGTIPLQTQTCFPYGAFEVDEETRNHYAAFALSTRYPLPKELPLHHPMLQSLEGRSPVRDSLPPWWADFVKQAPEDLHSLFYPLSIREFRTGCIDEKRWRQWREGQRAREDLPRSPKLAELLNTSPWNIWFEGRGDKYTPEELDLIISTRPDFLLNMSNGNGWRSCQHLSNGDLNGNLPGNWYDTGVAVAMLLPRGRDIWEGSHSSREGIVLARTTLRVLLTSDGQTLVVIGRCYDNNETTRLQLLSCVIAHCNRLGLAWGVMQHFSVLDPLRKGLMGTDYQASQRTDLTARGVPFWLPDPYRRPYIDGEFTWHTPQYEWMQLEAEVAQYLPTPQHSHQDGETESVAQ